MVRFNHCLINIVNICEIKLLKMIIEFFWWVGDWCLTPLSTLFQLYRGGKILEKYNF